MTEEQNKPFPELIVLECKGCGRCVAACPVNVLQMTENMNERGYHYVEYAGEGCTGCTNCFYSCPEPHAIKVHIPLKNKPATKKD